MLKSTFIAAAFGFVLIAPASATHDPEMKCDEATMTRYQADIDAMTDAEKRATSVKEMEMAREAMKANDTEKCLTHMDTGHQGARG